MKIKKSDLTAKILTLVIAIFLWSYVMSEENPIEIREYKNITVSYTNAAVLDRQGFFIIEPEEVKIDVEVTGKRNDFSKNKFNASNIIAQIDLSGYSEGQVKIPITVDLLGQPSGIRVVNHDPKEALFTLDSIISKEIPIDIDYQGELSEEYVQGTATARPQSIMISGPKTWVNEVQKAQAMIDLTGKMENFTVPTLVKILNDKGEEVRGVEKEPRFVDITIPIFRIAELPIELVTINELPENYAITDIKISPKTVVVKVDSSITQLKEIKSVAIDINTMLENEITKIELDLPEGVTLLNEDEEISISYNVNEIITNIIEFTFNDIEIRNLSARLRVENGVPEKYSIKLTGYDSDFKDVDLEGLNIYIDLDNYEKGEHQVVINWEEIDKFSIADVEPPTVKINITED